MQRLITVAWLYLGISAAIAHQSSRETVDFSSRSKHREPEFRDFMTQFGRTYSSPEEYDKRLAVFTKNLAHAESLHSAKRLPGDSASYGVTHFMDKTEEECVAVLLLSISAY